jgi:hypothetical protein
VLLSLSRPGARPKKASSRAHGPESPPEHMEHGGREKLKAEEGSLNPKGKPGGWKQGHAAVLRVAPTER